jgi:hypothetical protein
MVDCDLWSPSCSPHLLTARQSIPFCVESHFVSQTGALEFALRAFEYKVANYDRVLLPFWRQGLQAINLTCKEEQRWEHVILQLTRLHQNG